MGDRDWQVSSGSTWVRVAVTQFWADLHSHTDKSRLQDLAMLVNHLPLSLEADPMMVSVFLQPILCFWG